jgi:hypothetical protein
VVEDVDDLPPLMICVLKSIAAAGHRRHPLVTLLQVAERDAARIGSSLGLDPAGNARTVKRPVGGPLGQAHAPDRRPAVPRLSPLPPRLTPLTRDDLRGLTDGN